MRWWVSGGTRASALSTSTALEALLSLQLHEGVEHAISRTPARKRLVRHLGDAPGLADIAKHAIEIPLRLDHAEVSERPFQDVCDAWDAAACQVGSDHRIASIEADLQADSMEPSVCGCMVPHSWP